VLLTNTHDGSAALRMIPTTVRVVCQNTLSLALGRAGAREGLSVRHCESLERRVEEARENLGILERRVQEFEGQARLLAGASLTDAQAQDYFESVFPVPTRRPADAPVEIPGLLDAILDTAEERRSVTQELLAADREHESRAQARNRRILEQVLANYHGEANALPGVEGTAWAAYNAVSEWADHQSSVQGRSERQRADNRLQSVWFGSAAGLKERAFDAALLMAASA
jgi:phage/plasmid-like protein (TIGR03299 family)